MSDNDLIRRADALNAVAQIYGWSIAAAEEVEAAIAAIPAVQPTVSPDVAALVEVGNEMAKSIRGNYYIPGIAGKWEAALARVKGVM